MKNIKKIIWIILLILILNTSFLSVYWNNTLKNKELSREIIYRYIWEKILKEVPKSYKYIKLEFLDIKPNTKLYEALQKMVYVDIVSNKKININKNKYLWAYYFYNLINYLTWIKLTNQQNKQTLKSRNTSLDDLKIINSIINNINEKIIYNDIFSNVESNEEYNKFQILLDVYNTLLNEHLDSEKLDKIKIIYSAIEWLSNWSQDQFTTFFPPVKSKWFSQDLNWEFEWIWAYIEMKKPWLLKIISPISWFPAEKSWLKWWDIITKINEIIIDEKMSIEDCVALIKWPAWTTVKLTILRNNEELEIEILRAKIILKDVEYKIIDNKFFYIKVRMFWNKVFGEFVNSIEELKKQTEIKKVIIDLRNNPGWYLDSAVNILSLFIQKKDPVVIVKYKDSESSYNSYWYDKLDLWNYEIYILANSGTASASEIMIWTLKDYFPNIQIIWEKTYWKWSVQTIKSYYDWSTLKYTIAKWFTWKNKIWIDWVWISPDTEIILDLEQFKDWKDNQLDYIINY